MQTASRGWILRGLGILGIIGLVSGAIASDAEASNRKMRRQVQVFESLVDQMLVDSPNWLVRDSREARGSYVEGDGISVRFDVSLVNSRGWKRGWGGDWWDGWFDHDDHRVIIIDDDDDWDDDEDDDRKGRRRWKDRWLSKQERLYQRGKTEMVDTFLDFADILTALNDNEYIELDARLRRAEYFDENDLDRLVMRVKMADVRAYADEKMSEEDLIKKIEVKED